MRPHKLAPVTAILSIAWLAAVVAGFVVLERYKHTPGAAAQPRSSAPGPSSIERSTTRATLVVFAHPKCPCTRATMSELRMIMSQAAGAVDAHVVFMLPRDAPPDWEDSDLVALARSIPGVSVSMDAGGAEAARFGAKTSGDAVLLDPSGTVLYRGGITESRGHEGDNEGRRAILAVLSQQQANRSRGPVFGCALEDEDNAEPAREEAR